MIACPVCNREPKYKNEEERIDQINRLCEKHLNFMFNRLIEKEAKSLRRDI